MPETLSEVGLIEALQERSVIPLNATLIVAPIEQEKTQGGVLLTEGAKREVLDYTLGEVLSVGPGERDSNGKRMRLGVEPGDYVLYVADQAWRIEWGGARLVMLMERHIIGKVGKAPKDPESVTPVSHTRCKPSSIKCRGGKCRSVATLDRGADPEVYSCMCGWKTEAEPYFNATHTFTTLVDDPSTLQCHNCGAIQTVKG